MTGPIMVLRRTLLLGGPASELVDELPANRRRCGCQAGAAVGGATPGSADGRVRLRRRAAGPAPRAAGRAAALRRPRPGQAAVPRATYDHGRARRRAGLGLPGPCLAGHPDGLLPLPPNV